MPIQFNVIPQAGLRVPLFYAELNGAQTPYDSISRLLLCGQMLPSGSAEPGVAVHISGDPAGLFGRGAMLVDMVKKARLNAPFQEIWALPMRDTATAIPATGKIRCGVIAVTVKCATVPGTTPASADTQLSGEPISSSIGFDFGDYDAPAIPEDEPETEAAGDDPESGYTEFSPDPGDGPTNQSFGLEAAGDGALTGRPKVLNGIPLAVGDLVLVKDWGKANGIYTVTTVGTGSNGVWSRAPGFKTAAAFSQGMLVRVARGGQRGRYELATAAPYTLGTTKLLFTRFTGSGFQPLSATHAEVWIGEWAVPVVLYTTDSSRTLAARLVSVINAHGDMPVTASIGENPAEVVLTARHGGAVYNSIWLDTNYYGTRAPVSEAVFTFTQMSGGSGDPNFENALANLSDEPFDWIVGPYTDGNNMAAFETFLNPVSGRWSPYQQIYGQYLGVSHRNVSALMTQGSLWNSPTTSIFGIFRAASPTWCWAGALGGRIAAHLSQPVEMSRPLQSLDLIGILPPRQPQNRPNITDRNSLYYSGIGCYHVIGKQKIASIDRVVTNYRVNEWGMPDASWLDIETRAQSMYLIRALKTAVTGQYGRAALMDENPEGLEGVATPREIKAVIVHEYKRLNRLALVENPDLFAASLIVERSSVDANRVDCYLPIDVVNQLRIIAVNATIFLQRDQREQVAA